MKYIASGFKHHPSVAMGSFINGGSVGSTIGFVGCVGGFVFGRGNVRLVVVGLAVVIGRFCFGASPHVAQQLCVYASFPGVWQNLLSQFL